MSTNGGSYRIYLFNGTTSINVLTFNTTGLAGNTPLTQTFQSDGATNTVSFTGDGTTWNLYVAASIIFSPTTGVNTLLNNPAFNWSWANPIGATEILAGGMQVVYDSTHYVQMPRTGAATTLVVAGNITATGTITPGTSDRRLKTNIINIDGALDKLNKINGIYFNFNDIANNFVPFYGNKKQIGVIAQEVSEIFPDIDGIAPLAPFDNDGNDNSKSGQNYLTVQYEKIVPLLIEGIKELSKKVDDLQFQIISGSKI